MKGTNTYLNFDGETREAMTFYAKCLDAQLDIQSFKDAGMSGPPGTEDRIIHARLAKGSAVLMASDTMPGMSFTKGNNFWINIDCDDPAEQDRLFAAFGEGGKVLMELQDQFWGARFGMLTDKYGVGWMFNCEIPRKS
ncbi:MAG TPA: VOC family protein [Gemmatimonadaceae bacterium]|nr:VOC family protein [Gemmatimonadaceae bacterium]